MRFLRLLDLLNAFYYILYVLDSLFHHPISTLFNFVSLRHIRHFIFLTIEIFHD